MVPSTDDFISTGKVFYETVILVNGEVHVDAINLMENDTVLILFRGVGVVHSIVHVSPPCFHNATVRTGCGYGGKPCESNLRTHPLPSHSLSILYYFRPVLMSDNGLTITFFHRVRGTIRIFDSVTLSGKSV